MQATGKAGELQEHALDRRIKVAQATSLALRCKPCMSEALM